MNEVIYNWLYMPSVSRERTNTKASLEKKSKVRRFSLSIVTTRQPSLACLFKVSVNLEGFSLPPLKNKELNILSVYINTLYSMIKTPFKIAK